jgi:cysteine-rich repeat protein
MRGSTKVDGRRTRAPWTIVAALVPLLLSLAATAHAHGGRVPLEQWGGFPTASARCQRRFANAMAMAAARTWRVRVDCDGTTLAGGTCDEDAAKAAQTAASLDALNAIDFCSVRQLGDMGFLGLFDAQRDLVDFWRRWERMAESAVYDSVLRASGRAALTDPVRRQCVRATANAVTDEMRYVFRLRQRTMDRIAAVEMPPGDKTALVNRAARLIARSIEAALGRLRRHCSDQDFSSLYGRDSATFLQDLTERADCIGAKAYVQDAVPCPAPVCGNGIQELATSIFPDLPGEECDDGNAIDGDGCSSACMLEQ